MRPCTIRRQLLTLELSTTAVNVHLLNCKIDIYHCGPCDCTCFVLLEYEASSASHAPSHCLRPSKMRATAWLLYILGSISTVCANVEKTIFLGPSAIALPNARPGLDELVVDTLEPVELPILATQLSVKFPTESTPRGVDSWYLLRGLEEGRRYEVRVCWPAFVSP